MSDIDFAEIVHWLGHFVVSIDLKTRRFVYVTPGAAERLGASGTDVELRGPALHALLERLFVDDATRARMARLVEGDLGESETFEYRAVDPGAPRWRRATVRLLRDERGEPARLDLVSTDVTDLVQSRRATQHSEILRRIGERIFASPRLSDVIDIACSELRQGLGVARVALFLFDDATGVVSATGRSSIAGGSDPPLPRSTRAIMTAPYPVHGRVAQFRDVRTVADLPHLDYLLAAGVRTLATAAIGSDAEPMGMVFVATEGEERHFEPEEMALLGDVANLIAGPLARAALAEEKAAAAMLLRNTEERMQAALDATTTGIWDVDIATGVMTWDARCYELWELDPALGPQEAELTDRIHVEDRARFLDAFQRAGDPTGASELAVEYRYQGPSGVVRWLAARGRCFFTAERQPRRLIGTVVDVSAQHHAEAARLASERRYREIVESMTEGVGVLDAAGRLAFVNQPYARIFGYEDGSTLLGVHVEDLMFPEDRGPERERWFAHLSSGGGPTREVRRFRARGGQEVWVSLASVPIREEGTVTGLLGVLTDVTQARQLERKLQQAQKLESLGVLAGGIAHDFNNLLVGMLGNAGLARAELPPESSAQATLGSIETAALRASELTRQLLAYAGKGRFVVGRVDLRRLVEEMGHLLATVIGKSVTLRYDFGQDLPSIDGDATQLRQVVMNLITNASDAIGESTGVVSLATSLVDLDASHLADAVLDDPLPAGAYVCLEVSDTGAGMSAETRARIFDPFFTTKFTGRGLGLAAVLGIARAHRAGVTVTSELGRGTRFRLFLPAVSGAAAPNAAQPSLDASVPTERGMVLVVDDEAIVRNVVARALRKAGYDVLLASDGVEGVALHREHHAKIRAVILDQTMPKMSGQETYRQLRAIEPGVRVLLSSGYSEHELASEFAGVDGFLQKPFTVQQLLAKVAAVARGRAEPDLA